MRKENQIRGCVGREELRNKTLLRNFLPVIRGRLFKLHKKYRHIFGKTQYIQGKKTVL